MLERALPAGLRAPVESSAFRRLAASCFSEIIVLNSLSGWSKPQGIGAGGHGVGRLLKTSGECFLKICERIG